MAKGARGLTWFWSNNCLVLDEVRANRKRGGSERDEPDKTSGNTGGGRRQSLESRMLGNLHVRFGGGVGKHSSAVRLAPTLQWGSTYGELRPWLKTLPDGPASGSRFRSD
jgi:hypothetical protein